MALVYVIQKQMRWDERQGELVPRFNLGPAEEYGELVYILSPTASPFNPDPILKDMAQKLKSFSSEDYLLLVGNPCLIGWAVAQAAYAADGPVQLLQWHGRDKRYIVVEADPIIDLQDILEPSLM